MKRPLAMPEVQPRRYPVVTDHAVVRWMERHLGYDIEAVRRAILTPEREEAIRCGATSIVCREEGVTLRIAPNGHVTTVLTNKSAKRL